MFQNKIISTNKICSLISLLIRSLFTRANLIKIFILIILCGIFAIYKLRIGVYISRFEFMITIMMLGFLALSAPNYIYSLSLGVTAITLIVDSHFIRLYGNPLCWMHEQCMNSIRGTDIREIINYFQLISLREFLYVFVVLLVLLFLCFLKRNKVNNYVWIISFLIFMIYGIHSKTMFSIGHAITRDFREKEIIKKKNAWKWNAKSTKQSPEVVLLCIGESHRADFFYKYWRKYPEIKHSIIFENMISQFSYTQKAMPQILSHKKVDDNTLFYHESSLFKLFSEAGYATYYVSYFPIGLDDSISFITKESDNVKNYGRTYQDGVNDIDIIKLLHDIFKNKEKKFIVIKMIGCHFDFQYRYPEEYDLLKPSLKHTNAERCEKNRDIYISTYQNAVNYSCSVVRRIFRDTLSVNDRAIAVFVSDHGFDIFDDGFWYSSKTQKAFHIPFIIGINDKFYDEIDSNIWSNLKKHKTSALIENDIFDTLVSICGITRRKIPRNRDLTILSAPLTEKRSVSVGNGQKMFYEDLKY